MAWVNLGLSIWKTRFNFVGRGCSLVQLANEEVKSGKAQVETKDLFRVHREAVKKVGSLNGKVENAEAESRVTGVESDKMPDFCCPPCRSRGRRRGHYLLKPGR